MKKVTLLVLLFATVFFVSSCVLINRRPPTVNIPDQVINEGEVLSINLFDFIEDQKDESLFFVHIEGPGGIQGEKTFNFSPSYDDSGSWKVVVRLRNGKGKFTDVQFFVEVLDVNRSPIISVPNVVTEEGDTVEIDFDDFSSDPDDDDLEFSLLKGEGSLNGSLYEFSPSFGNPGAHEVTVAVIDTKGASDSCDFIIEVKHVNRKPEISIPDQEVNEGDKLLLNLTEFASDPDFDTLSFSLFSEIGILETTKLIIEPNYAQSGSYSVTVGVSDGEAPMEFCTFTLTINDVNREPLADIPDFAVKEGETLYINLLDYCNDPDGDKLTFEKETGVGDLQGSIYSYAPDYGVLKKLHELSSRTDEGARVDQEVMINVSDSKGFIVKGLFTVSVTDANRAPTLNIPDFSIDAGTSLRINLKNYANDADNDGLAFSLIDGVGNIDGSEYTYGSDSEDEGEYEVTAEVKDEKGASGRDTFLITVRGSSKNLFLTLNDRIVHEDQNLTINLIDFTTGGSGNYSYELISGLGKVIGNTYTYSATTSEHGTWMVKIKVSDSSMNEYIDSFLVIVNRYPRFFHMFGRDVNEGYEGEVDLSGYSEDPDGDEMTYSIFGLPGEIEGNYWNRSFGYDDAGEYSGILRVTDSKGAHCDLEITFHVIEYNPPPVMEVPNQKVEENDQLVLNLEEFTFDHEGETFEFSKTQEWNANYLYSYCTLVNGVFTFSPDFEFIRRPYNTGEATPTTNLQFVIRVTDERNSFADYRINVTVENVNRPPTIPEPIFPADGAKGVNTDCQLEWYMQDLDLDITKVSLYFGLQRDNLELLVSSNDLQNFALHSLEIDTTYYWKVVAEDDWGARSESHIWSFTTTSMFVSWQACLGGSSWERHSHSLSTFDGGLLVMGLTDSNDGDVSGNHGETDTWIVKLDSVGNIEWQKCLGGSSFEDPSQLIECYDGGFIVMGCTGSNDGDVSGFHGETDIWIVKLDSVGNIEWQKCLGGSSLEQPKQLIEASDGGVIMLGMTGSNDGDVSGFHGETDIWIVKLDSDGNIEWQNSFGGSSWDDPVGLIQEANGALVLLGNTASNDGDVSGNNGESDIWVLNLDFTGNIVSQKCIGGSSDDWGIQISNSADGGLTVLGGTYSNDGNVSGNNGETDIWLLKLDSTMNIIWQECIGGSSEDWGLQISSVADGGLLLLAGTRSIDGDILVHHGNEDIWLLKLDSFGSIELQTWVGGSSEDVAQQTMQITDESFLIIGETCSNDGDISGNHGQSDILIAEIQKY